MKTIEEWEREYPAKLREVIHRRLDGGNSTLSTSMVQRELGIGYNYAMHIIERGLSDGVIKHNNNNWYDII